MKQAGWILGIIVLGCSAFRANADSIPRGVFVAIVDAAGEPAGGVRLEWVAARGTMAESRPVGPATWFVKLTGGDKHEVRLTRPDATSALVRLALPDSAETGLLLQFLDSGVRVEWGTVDAVREYAASHSAGPPQRFESNSAVVTGGKRIDSSAGVGQANVGDDCDPLATVYFNGTYDTTDPDLFALSAERRTNGTLTRWVVDDVLLEGDSTIRGVHWWGNEATQFNWSGGADYIVLDSTGGQGSPGAVVASGFGVSATRFNTMDGPLFGDPIWFYSITGLDLPLTPGTWWFGVRTVQNFPFGGQGWWVTATGPITGSEAFIDYGPNAPAWEPASSFFGRSFDVAFCLSGEVGPFPFGSCCDNATGVCEDCAQGGCGAGSLFFPNRSCASLDPPCGEFTGACCDLETGLCEEVTPAECSAAGGLYGGDRTTCATPNICPCTVVCPAGADVEAEPVCGGNYVDSTNPGCDTIDAPQFTPLACGQTICGTSGTFVGELPCVVDDDCPTDQTCSGDTCSGGPFALRDTDWYEVEVDAEMSLRLLLSAEFQSAVFLIDGRGGCDGAETIAFVREATCEELTLSRCLAPGTYYVVVAPDRFTGVACGSDYMLSAECGACAVGACCFPDGSCQPDQPRSACEVAGGRYAGDNSSCTSAACAPTPPNDECPQANSIAFDTLFFGNNFLARDDDFPACGTSAPDAGVWFRVTGTGSRLTVSTCHPETNFDTKLQVFCDCSGLGCIGGVDDPSDAPAECILNGLNRKARLSFCSIAGQEYFIHLGGVFDDRGTYGLTVSEEGPCGDATPCSGACCVLGACAATEGAADCLSREGQWYQGETCPDFSCAPARAESCADATIIDSGSFQLTTDLATAEANGPAGPCAVPGANAMQNDAWFRYTASEDCLLMARAESVADGDVLLALYEGSDCGSIVPAGPTTCEEPRTSAAEQIVLHGGESAWIQMGDAGLIRGGGLTTLTVEGVPLAAVGACCHADGTCDLLQAEACAAGGGAFHSAVSSCDEASCPTPSPNDECEEAIDVGPLPASHRVSNKNATGADVWFAVRGNGRTLVAETCGAGSGVADTFLEVYCDRCEAPSLIAGDDDSCAPHAALKWCSAPGVTYLVRVGGIDATRDRGEIQLGVREEANCADAVACPRTYCISRAVSAGGAGTSAVVLDRSTLSVDSACAPYTRHATESAISLTPGRRARIAVRVGGCGTDRIESAAVAAYIDFNRDLDFDDPGERVLLGDPRGSRGEREISGVFEVPWSAVPGLSRLRVVAETGAGSPPSPCGSYPAGETEDFDLTILPATNLSAGPWDDLDDDGLPNFCDNCPDTLNSEQEDSDADGFGNACDECPGFDDGADQDADGVPDGCDVCEGGDDALDADGDTVPDGCDNCPSVANVNQDDRDADGVGDVCDNCPGVSNPAQGDSDDDGFGNVCDTCNGFDDSLDADGDGVADGCDQCPGADDHAPGNLDDDDGDGVVNCADLCPGIDDGAFAPQCLTEIPAVSTWGMIALLLLVLSSAKILFHSPADGRR
ncbi:MAG: hypothetical protein J5J06_14425 [Phycisphaerae bacterium]|nr:hypothetical protein [Phycisphaerae bacterium]